jgi:Dockerin type I domain/PEP-CTERM motif
MNKLMFRGGFAVMMASLLCGLIHAAPVTNWQTDPLLASVALSAADTASPVWGSGTADSTNGSAIWASIPTQSIIGNRRLAISASVQLVGSNSANEQFRFGLFNNNGSSDTTKWLGILAQNSAGTFAGELSAKNPAGQDFATTTWASILGSPPRATPLGTAVDPEGDQFNEGTYDLRLTIERNTDTLNITASIIGGTFQETWSNVFLADPTLITYDYNRVGFFAGSALGADQINLTNVDVSLVTPGDTNGDNLVNMTDYLTIFHHLNLSGQTLATGDLNGDGKVGVADFRIWKDNRSDIPSGSGGATSLNIPEPASLRLLIVGAAGLIWRRRLAL